MSDTRRVIGPEQGTESLQWYRNLQIIGDLLFAQEEVDRNGSYLNFKHNFLEVFVS